MSNYYSSSDDDIFEDYVEDSLPPLEEPIQSSSRESFDQIFSDLDSPFKELILKTTFKVNLGESFYTATKEWENHGYLEANNKAILSQLAELTNGKFLYHHRLISCAEIIARKKTVLKFLDLLLNEDQQEALVRSADSKIQFQLTRSYFEMFFGSFKKIYQYFYIRDVALHRSLSDLLGFAHDEDLYDINKPSNVIHSTADTINDLYLKYFDNDAITDSMVKYLDQSQNNKA